MVYKPTQQPQDYLTSLDILVNHPYFHTTSLLQAITPVTAWDMVMATAVLDNFAQNVTHSHMSVKIPHLAGLHRHHDHNGVVTSKQLIGEALRQRVESIDHEMCDPGDEDTFFVADLGEVYRQHLRWKKNLPRVKPFYGMFLAQICHHGVPC